MNAIDRQILEFCRDGFRPLKPLIGPIASGTVYRHARRLGALGWLRKEGALYRTTDAGLRELEARSTGQPPEPLVRLYPPLAQVPTAVHRAVIALILAAAVARRHEVRPDRHRSLSSSGRPSGGRAAPAGFSATRSASIRPRTSWIAAPRAANRSHFAGAGPARSSHGAPSWTPPSWSSTSS